MHQRHELQQVCFVRFVLHMFSCDACARLCQPREIPQVLRARPVLAVCTCGACVVGVPLEHGWAQQQPYMAGMGQCELP